MYSNRLGNKKYIEILDSFHALIPIISPMFGTRIQAIPPGFCLCIFD